MKADKVTDKQTLSIERKSPSTETLAHVREALVYERDALDALLEKLDHNTARAVDVLFACAGRVVVTGMGKAGLIGQKLAATFCSTGTPAMFMHPAEALHGDLGMVSRGDVVLVLSNSGETGELLAVLPHLKSFGLPIVALTGVPGSSLGRQSDVVVDVGVPREADPTGAAPTASTTAMLAMGDALAAALIVRRGFTRAQFAMFHPGGSLGRNLLSRVSDLMITGDRLPLIHPDATVREAIYELASKRLGGTFVVSIENNCLMGIFTDGDLGRLLQREANPLELRIGDVMTKEPKRITEDVLAIEAMRIMEDHAITLLPVVDGAMRPFAAIHLHDLVKAGLKLWPERVE
jgi:arabinose-5-phosphate isomerase